MVLSNKKLKEKLRSLLADSIASEPKKPAKDSSKPNINGEVQSIKELLSSKSRKKPKTPNQKKRRKKQPLEENQNADEGAEETQEGNDDNALKQEKKKKKKKVKKEDKEESESKKRKREEEQRLIDERKKRKKEKKMQRRKKKEGEEIVKENENVETENDEKKVGAPVKIDESEIKKLYVGGIPYYSSEDDIRSFFDSCGTITEVDCMTFPESGKFRGIAILTFKTEAAARRALALDGADMGGFYLKIQPYNKPQRVQKPEFAPKVVNGYNRVYVGNLSWDITEDDLKLLFSDCKVSSIRFGMDKESGEFKGYAHVDFADTVSLTLALKLDQSVVCGRPVKISCAVPPKKGADINSLKKPAAATAAADKGENDGTGGGGSKKKRRTCYVCGVPGHLSSACPKKKAAADDDGAGAES